VPVCEVEREREREGDGAQESGRADEGGRLWSENSDSRDSA